MQRKEGAFFQTLALPFHFWLPLLPSHFCPSFQKVFTGKLLIKTQKKKKKKKTIEKKKNAENGWSFPSSSYFALSLLAPTPTFPLLPFCFKHFLLTSSCFQAKEKKRKPQRKKICKERRELTFKLSLCFSLLALAFGLLFLPFNFKRFLLGIFFFSSKRKERKTQREKNHREEKKCKKGRAHTSRFCIWGEALLLLSPLHIPSMLSSPPSSSLASHISSKVCAIQA